MEGAVLTREQAEAIKRNLEANMPALREQVRAAEQQLAANAGVLQFVSDLLAQAPPAQSVAE